MRSVVAARGGRCLRQMTWSVHSTPPVQAAAAAAVKGAAAVPRACHLGCPVPRAGHGISSAAS